MTNNLFGTNVRTSDLVRPVPVLQLHPDFTACTESFRVEMNAWLLDMFGTKEVAYVFGDTIVLNDEMLRQLKALLVNKGYGNTFKYPFANIRGY